MAKMEHNAGLKIRQLHRAVFGDVQIDRMHLGKIRNSLSSCLGIMRAYSRSSQKEELSKRAKEY